MSEKTTVALYDEIVKIRQLLEMTVRGNIKKELENILTTPERKTVWALSDGETDTKAIADKVGISLRAVQVTLKDLQQAGLIVIERRGFPKRKFDYVPPDWKLIKERKIDLDEQRTGDSQGNLS
jgi:DNA-binding transcriptional ArsR family regulator